MIDFSDFSLDDLLKIDLAKLDAEDLEAFDSTLEELGKREAAKVARNSLLAFCVKMNPDYKIGKHHKRLATLLEDMAFNRKDRIAVSIPPRHGKSFMVSVYFPAWFLGNFPDKKVLMVSHTTDLAVDFGRKVRNLVDLDIYKEIFPTVTLAADSKSAGRWNTNAGGEYFACGVGSALAGRGADFLIIDDPFSEQDILNGNFEVFQKAYEWFTFGARTRLMPGGRVAIVHTRWHPSDLIGMMAKDMVRNTDSDQYEFFEFPAIFNEGSAEERALWPEFFDLDALRRTKASMPSFQWNAQYQQQPTSEEGALIKREWWMAWEEEDPPTVDFIIMTLDAAAEKNNRADFTALLTWGVFTHRLTGDTPHIILLNAINKRVEFPELKDLALQEYREWEPDAFIVEKKSNGTPLFQELRRMGIPVSEFTPHRGTGDKVARLNAVADIFRSGMVWYPAGRRWAEEVVEQVAAFPASEHDDMVDCFVSGTLIETPYGSRRIETLIVGDLVLTHLGFRRVTAAVCTGEHPVWALNYGSGTLTGTGNHPIHTQNGWKALDKLDRRDTIDTVSTTELLSWLSNSTGQIGKRLYLTGLPTRNTLSGHILNVLVGGIFCTGIFGYSTTARFLKASISTIRMGIAQIILWTTLRCFPQVTTTESTILMTPSVLEPQNIWRTWLRYAPKQQSGMAPRQGWSGIGITHRIQSSEKVQPPLTRKWFPKSVRAYYVEQSSWQKRQQGQNTVAIDATPVRQMLESAMQRLRRVGAVLIAEILSILYKRGQNTAVSNAKVCSIAPAGKQQVYNLSVEEAETYYANGVLVHNCTSMALARFRSGGFISLKSDVKDDNYSSPRKAAYY